MSAVLSSQVKPAVVVGNDDISSMAVEEEKKLRN
jgi:hypothetical protein